MALRYNVMYIQDARIMKEGADVLVFGSLRYNVCLSMHTVAHIVLRACSMYTYVSVDDLKRFYTGSDIMDIPRVLYKSYDLDKRPYHNE